jgi:hypothetical protein
MGSALLKNVAGVYSMATIPILVNPAEEVSDMATANELTGWFERLDERVKNHIKFFWCVAAFQFACMTGLLYLVLQTKSAVVNLAQIQANAPAQVAANILSVPISSSEEAKDNLTAVTAILRSADRDHKKATATALKPVSTKLVSIAQQYPDLPQVWKATADFINYKFDSAIPESQEMSRKVFMDCSHGGSTTILNGEIQFTNCELDLTRAVGGSVRQITFINCIIHYDGGPVPAAPMIFDRCLFRFNVPVVPPPRGIRTMQILAEATENIVQIPS